VVTAVLKDVGDDVEDSVLRQVEDVDSDG